MLLVERNRRVDRFGIDPGDDVDRTEYIGQATGLPHEQEEAE
jgi:hypothetical protein